MDTRFIAFSLTACLFLAGPSPLYGDFYQKILTILTLDSLKVKNSYDPSQFEETIDDDPTKLPWVKILIQNYPELVWLADKNVDITQEGIPKQHEKSWSYRIWGHHYPEFDRAVLSIWALRSIHKGCFDSYRYFTASQTEETLGFAQFIDLHIQLNQILSSFSSLKRNETLKTLEVALVLSDLGKTPTARQKARAEGLICTHPQDFYRMAMQNCPTIFPTMACLPFPYQEILIKASAVAHFEHIRNLEGNPNVFRNFSGASIEKAIFNFAFFVNICDNAARKGHMQINGCSNFTSSVNRSLQEVHATCSLHSANSCHERYMHYLKARAAWLGLGIETAEERVLVRVGSMLGLTGLENGRLLKRSFAKLDVRHQALVLSQFDPREKDPLIRTPTYIPAILKNMLEHRSLGHSLPERLDKTLILSLPFIAQVLKEHRENLRENPKNNYVPLNFNQIAKAIKDNPYALNYVQYELDSEHHVIPY